MFGKVVVSDATVAECVAPKYSEKDELAQTAAQPMYVRSHHSWGTGQQEKRNYTAPFNDLQRYGKPSPHSKEGKWVKQTLKWYVACYPCLCRSKHHAMYMGQGGLDLLSLPWESVHTTGEGGLI